MKFHSHLTVYGRGDIPAGWKKTDIILEHENRVQHDVMMTKHYKLGMKHINTVQDIIEDIPRIYGAKITRLKVEQDSGFYLPITRENYLEIHMLCPTGAIPTFGEWRKSHNPKSLGPDGLPNYFYNKRIYSSDDTVEEVSSYIKDRLDSDKVRYLEFKVEQVVYDSNREMDRWWA